MGDKLDCQPTTKSVTLTIGLKGAQWGSVIEQGRNVDHITYPPIDNLLTTEELKKYQIPQELKWLQIAHNLCLKNHIALERFKKKIDIYILPFAKCKELQPLFN